MSRYPQRRDPKTGQTFYVHRAVAEWHLGRKLELGEVVHHKNEIKSDDHPLNLRVFRSQAEHMRYHHYLRRQTRGVQHLFDLETWLELHA